MRLHAVFPAAAATALPAAATALLAAATLLGAGCTSAPPPKGPDDAYLTAPLDENEGQAPDTRPLLPLATGNVWKFLSVSEGKRASDESVVTGPVVIAGRKGINVEIRRAGVKWRREVYSADDTQKGIALLAAQDESSGLMVLNPPLPLVRYPAQSGQVLVWRGTFTLNNQTLPARGISRISAMEVVRSEAGRFDTARIDTQIVVNKNGQEVQFPSVRWLAPGVGLVRRGFAERGRPAFSELTQFSLK